MKTMIISRDEKLIQMIDKIQSLDRNQIIVYNNNNDSLKIVSAICSSRPSILIIDDDFLAPYSVNILTSIKELHKNAYIIFITSNSTIELGREVSPLGIHYYAIKPISASDLSESLTSIIKQKEKENY